MVITKQYILSSFVSERGGGNKAAVVLSDYELREEQMKTIALTNNLSETAFINTNQIKGNEVMIRYFTPKEEVDICGHAALASFYILKQENIISGAEFKHITKAGQLSVNIKDDLTFIEMAQPHLICEISVEDIISFTDLKSEDIVLNENSKVSVISTGLKDIILEVKTLNKLKDMKIKKQQMIDFCNEKDLIGMHIVSRETMEKDSDFACRNFAPAVGIDEESATGTSNASLIYYMSKRYELNDNKLFKIEQGYFMDMPSNIFVRPVMETDKHIIFVGGNVKLLEEQELFL